jgi:hypothetical protein
LDIFRSAFRNFVIFVIYRRSFLAAANIFFGIAQELSYRRSRLLFIPLYITII